MKIVFCTGVGLFAIALAVAALVGIIWCAVVACEAIADRWPSSKTVGRGIHTGMKVLYFAAVFLIAAFGLLMGAHAAGCRIIKLF